MTRKMRKRIKDVMYGIAVFLIFGVAALADGLVETGWGIAGMFAAATVALALIFTANRMR